MRGGGPARDRKNKANKKREGYVGEGVKNVGVSAKKKSTSKEKSGSGSGFTVVKKRFIKHGQEVLTDDYLRS